MHTARLLESRVGPSVLPPNVGAPRVRAELEIAFDTSEGATCPQATSVPAQLLLPDRDGTKQHDVGGDDRLDSSM